MRQSHAGRTKGSIERLMIPSWTEDLGALQDAAREGGAYVEETCSECRGKARLDLDELIDDLGPRFTLWNFHPACGQPGCSGRTWFRAQPSNYFHVILQDAPEQMVEPMRDRWRATLSQDLRDRLPLLPMLEATGRIAIAACGQCEVAMYLSLTSLRAWVGRRSMLDLAEKVRCAGGPRICEMVVEMFPRELVPPGELQGL